MRFIRDGIGAIVAKPVTTIVSSQPNASGSPP